MKLFIGCSSKKEIDGSYLDMVSSISKRISNLGYDLVIGGNLPSGPMKTIVDEFRNNGRLVYINSLSKYDEELVGNMECFDDTFTRNKENYNEADMILILPGGIGTLSELFSMLEEKRTREDKKEFIIYNYNNFYMDIITLLARLNKDKFNDKNILESIRVFNTEDDLLNYLEEVL